MTTRKNLVRLLWSALALLLLVGCRNTSALDDLLEWDLVYISDSSGWGVAEKLAENIERDTGKTVHLHDYALAELPATRVLEALQTVPTSLSDIRFKSFQADITEAEMIVFFANPRGDASKGGIRGGMEVCIAYGAGQLPKDCTLQLYKPYIENLKAIYVRILELRNGKPTIIRAVDFYNPAISQHRQRNMETECTECWETFNTAVQEAADAFDIPFVSVYDAFNGIEHNEDPRDKGYIGSDGIHTSELGKQIIADLLSEVGYQPIGQ